jgi:hypothetical protein
MAVVTAALPHYIDQAFKMIDARAEMMTHG